MDNWESLRRPTHPIPDPTHPTLLFERRGATCVTCHVDIDTRDRTTASFFIVLKDFSGVLLLHDIDIDLSDQQ